jgi:signal transduction histidine kinase
LRQTYFSLNFISVVVLITGSFFLIYSDFLQLAIQSSSVFSSGYSSDIGWTLAFSLFGIAAIAKQKENKILQSINLNQNFKNIYNFISFSYIYIWLGAMYFMLLWAFNHTDQTERNFYVIVISLIIGLIVLRLVVSSIENYKLQLKYKATLEQLQESNLEFKELNNDLAKESHKLIITNNELLNSEAELKKANDTKNKLFSIISHDIRSPLNAMLVSTETVNLYFDKFSKEELAKAIRSVFLSTQQLSNLITNLFDWAKAQRDGIQFNPEFQNLTILTEQILKLYSENLKQKNLEISLNYNLKNDIAIAYCDKNLYETIIRNLISNAIKFSKTESEIKITFSDLDDKFIQISVSDTGIGIAEEDIPKLFRDDIDRKKIGNSPEKGSGLGLLLCKEFVEKHKGQIWVESQLEQGTTFHFTIPIKNIF